MSLDKIIRRALDPPLPPGPDSGPNDGPFDDDPGGHGVKQIYNPISRYAPRPCSTGKYLL